MSSLRPQDRKSLCRFTFADGRQCRTPRCPHHPHFCSDHAAKTLKPAPPINSPANCPISSPANTFPPAISVPPSAAFCPPSSAVTLSPAPPAPSPISPKLSPKPSILPSTHTPTPSATTLGASPSPIPSANTSITSPPPRHPNRHRIRLLNQPHNRSHRRTLPCPKRAPNSFSM